MDDKDVIQLFPITGIGILASMHIEFSAFDYEEETCKIEPKYTKDFCRIFEIGLQEYVRLYKEENSNVIR